jgi:hypothetical protein
MRVHLGENSKLSEAAQTLRRRVGGCGGRWAGHVVVVNKPAHDGGGDDVADVFAFFQRLWVTGASLLPPLAACIHQPSTINHQPSSANSIAITAAAQRT